MKKSTFRKLALIVASVMAFTIMLTACNSNSSNNEPASPAEPSGPPTTAYLIGFNTWGSGVPIIDLFGDETEYALRVLGMRGSRVSDDYTADKELQNAQNFISAGVDGIALQGAAVATVPQIADECLRGKMPFVLTVFIGDDDDRAVISANNSYYVGAVNSDLYFDGYVLGQSAIRDGCKTACIIGGNIGDNNMDQRIDGFAQSFVVEGGGTILGEARCTSPAESLQKASDMLSTYRDADCLYALVGDYVPGPLTAMDNIGITEMKIYASCIDLSTANYIKEGRVVEGNDGIGLSAVIAPAMLVNYLDGHPIMDPSGRAAEFKTVAFLVTKENADDYISIFYTPGVNPVTEDILKSLVWRFNPDVTYQTYADLIANGLTLEALLKAHGR